MNNHGTKSIISEKLTGYIVGGVALILFAVITYFSFK